MNILNENLLICDQYKLISEEDPIRKSKQILLENIFCVNLIIFNKIFLLNKIFLINGNLYIIILYIYIIYIILYIIIKEYIHRKEIVKISTNNASVFRF